MYKKIFGTPYLFTLTTPVFEGLQDDIYFVVTRYTQPKLLKENEGPVERKQSTAIVIVKLMPNIIVKCCKIMLYNRVIVILEKQ